MQLERLLQIAMTTMAALGTLLLGMGQRSGTLPTVVVVAAALSIWLTDFRGWFRLNRTVANFAALLAVLFAAWHLLQMRGHGASGALAIADFLVYLQVVLFFQKKDERIYWQLVMLSLLQVVVAAAFNQRSGFGLLLLVYLFVGLSALALLFVYRERLLFRQTDEPPPPPRRQPGARWPLARRVSDFTGSSPAATQEAVGAELLRRLGGMVASTLVLTLLLFFTMPRLGNSAWRSHWTEPRRAVGFSGNVTLGELGEIIENPQEVMRVEFYRFNKDERYPVGGGIYLRGALLSRYGQGEWRQPPANSNNVGPLTTSQPLPDEEMVRQLIEIEPMDRPELFCVWPPVRWQVDRNILYDPVTERLLRPINLAQTRLAYELLTTGLSDGRQTEFTPCDSVPSRRYLQLPENGDGQPSLPGLVDLTNRLVAEASRQPEETLSIVRYLERYLRDSGHFQYSLVGQVRDLDLDPIEDFVTRHPVGHCEYFATALAMMLRSQGIPSRVVLGYHTDEWDDVGEFYQVRQLHAHTWVEAYIPPSQLPETIVQGGSPWAFSAGAWLRLDPTPAGGPMVANFPGAKLFDRITSGMRWLDRVWANYVVEMDRRRQREAIYTPIGDALDNLAETLTSGKTWYGWAMQAKALLASLWPEDWRDLLTLVGILVFPVTLLVLAGWRYAPRVWQLVRLRARLWWVRLRPPGPNTVAFYRRLELLLARRGQLRSPGETPREFVVRAASEWTSGTSRAEIVDLSGLVVDAYYQVRYGHHPLDTDEQQAVEHALQALDQVIS